MTGKTIRLQRLFDGDLASGKIVVSAIDHGMFQGVQRGLENLDSIMIASQKVDAILMGPGMIEQYAGHFSRKGRAHSEHVHTVLPAITGSRCDRELSAAPHGP